MLKRTQLRQFLALVQTGSFTAAANQLHLTQPTLSAGIAELERSLGTPLFRRERRAIRLTEAGNRLLVHARAIEREFRQAEATLTTVEPPSAPLRLGVAPSIATAMIESIVSAYAGKRLLEVVEAGDAELRRRLAEQRLDAALTLLRDGEASPAWHEEPYRMVLPAAHPLAARVALEPEELAGETMIARRSCEILAETSRFFTARGVRPHFVYRSHNDDRALALVRAGAGITTAPASLAVEGTVALPLAGYTFRRRIGLIAEAARPLDAALQKAVEKVLKGAKGR